MEQLATEAKVSVDTVRYYQSKGLLEPPRREGRVAWYGPDHLQRIGRIRSLQARGFTLATIVRLVNGDLDAADEALVAELSVAPGTGTAGADDPRASTRSRTTGADLATTPDDRRRPPDGAVEVTGAAAAERCADAPTPEGAGGAADDTTDDAAGAGGTTLRADELLTLEGLAERTGVPLALLKAVEAEGLLIPRRVGTEERYTREDVDAARAGLLLLEWGVPLTALLDLARRHHAATEFVAREAVDMFSTHVRGSLRRQSQGTSSSADDAARLVQAYTELLPAVDTLVGHHFNRSLLRAAFEHIEAEGTDAERRAVWAEAATVVADAPPRVDATPRADAPPRADATPDAGSGTAAS